ncbi:MAG: histidine kinase [Clostridia bacterium]|nr:histidine kinase [Clostridia bacterium]
MTDWMYHAEFLIAGALLTMMATGIAFSVFMPALDKWNKRFFIVLFSLLFLCAVTCFLALIFYNDPAKATTERVIYFFESLFMAVPIFMPTIFLLRCLREKVKRNALFSAMIALLGVYFAFLIIAQFTDVFYYVTPDNRFFYGPLYGLSLVPLVLILLLNIAGVIIRRKKLSKKHFTALLIYLLPMTAAIILHMFISVELFVIFGMALFAMIMFGLILSDNMEQYKKQQQEIAHQRASVMVLQMRPHFIYNTMTTIYYLCKQDADKAQQVTLDFTDYLRQNFTAIASEDTVPFADELRHTQSYLAVEKAQHEDMLVVEYDTPYTHFRVPPLTLQPLVENAVKHAMDPNAAPLHITIRTKKTDAGVLITVEDNGRGFDPNDKLKPHPALDNIENRLKQQCGGTLKIDSAPGCTTVTIIIPNR